MNISDNNYSYHFYCRNNSKCCACSVHFCDQIMEKFHNSSADDFLVKSFVTEECLHHSQALKRRFTELNHPSSRSYTTVGFDDVCVVAKALT